ncbi:pilus assembly protein PilP [Desulfobacter curvatus]|uniref:pilus assembly protein PilP n=1 Tax=Desulfobacter curvatus TaxID=2290 RepID=UPI000378DD60|nr:pilus assembly protein PilP [Desulfobacter curvatus]
MEKLIKICCVVGLGTSLLFVSACNEDQAQIPNLTKPPQVISKPISKSNPPATQMNVTGDNGKKQVLGSDLKSPQNSVNDKQVGDDSNAAADLRKAGISTPMEKYNSKGRVDPFVPLIAEKTAYEGSGSSGDSKPKRTLTPLEKLELSQVKLVAVVEMQGRTIAMVEETTGKGYEVSIGTYIGPNGGRVTSITRQGIKIEETVKDYQGKQRKRYEEIKFHKSEDGE